MPGKHSILINIHDCDNGVEMHPNNSNQFHDKMPWEVLISNWTRAGVISLHHLTFHYTWFQREAIMDQPRYSYAHSSLWDSCWIKTYFWSIGPWWRLPSLICGVIQVLYQALCGQLPSIQICWPTLLSESIAIAFIHNVSDIFKLNTTNCKKYFIKQTCRSYLLILASQSRNKQKSVSLLLVSSKICP